MCLSCVCGGRVVFRREDSGELEHGFQVAPIARLSAVEGGLQLFKLLSGQDAPARVPDWRQGRSDVDWSDLDWSDLDWSNLDYQPRATVVVRFGQEKLA